MNTLIDCFYSVAVRKGNCTIPTEYWKACSVNYQSKRIYRIQRSSARVVAKRSQKLNIENIECVQRLVFLHSDAVSVRHSLEINNNTNDPNLMNLVEWLELKQTQTVKMSDSTISSSKEWANKWATMLFEISLYIGLKWVLNNNDDDDVDDYMRNTCTSIEKHYPSERNFYRGEHNLYFSNAISFNLNYIG